MEFLVSNSGKILSHHIAVFGLVEKKTSRCMLPHPHRAPFNIEACMVCGEKRLCHPETDAEKHCKPKIEPVLQTALWRPLNRSTHIKRKK
jgi:hypothetical protein